MALKQATLFGGTVKESTYYNHEPKSRFVKFIEASFFFNKHGKSKEENQCFGKILLTSHYLIHPPINVI